MQSNRYQVLGSALPDSVLDDAHELPNLQKEFPMKAPYLALAPLVLMLGCTTAAPEFGPVEQTRVQYACGNGENIEMRFFPVHGVGVLVRNGKTMELQQQPAASGFLYSNGPTTVRGKGNDLTLEIGRMVPIQCEAS